MATITLKDILGSDNIAASRLDISKNFKTIQESLNTFEGYLNTSANGDVSVGNIKINIGANAVIDPLFKLEASGVIDGNLDIGGNLNVIGSTSFTNLNLGTSGNVNFTLTDVVYIDKKLGAPTIIDASTGGGVYDLDPAGVRAIALNFGSLSGNSGSSVVRMAPGVVGQLVYLTIYNHGDPTDANSGIYFHKTGMDPNYDSGTNTPYNGGAGIPTAVGFTGATLPEFKTKWIELVYQSTGWRVYNAHPQLLGI